MGSVEQCLLSMLLSDYKETKPSKRKATFSKPPQSQEQQQESTQPAFWMEYFNTVGTVLLQLAAGSAHTKSSLSKPIDPLSL